MITFYVIKNWSNKKEELREMCRKEWTKDAPVHLCIIVTKTF